MMENQWEIKGDCRLCRRRFYCVVPCKKFNENFEKVIEELVDEAIKKQKEKTK